MISRTYTHPQDAGNRQRIYRECCKMKELGWDIDFLYYGSIEAVDLDAMIAFFGVDHFWVCENLQYSVKSQIRSEIRKKLDQQGITKYISIQYNKDDWFSTDVDEMIQYLLGKKQYDAVWMQYFFQSKSFERIDSKIIKITDTHDKFGNRDRIFRKKGVVPEFFYTSKNGEKKALARADVIVAIQNREKEYFAGLLSKYNTKVVTIGDMIELHHVEDIDEKCYGFIGGINKPNILSIKWFIDKILPIIKKMDQESKFYIAGNICNQLEDSDRYIKLGKVEQVDEFYKRVKFVVCPIISGTGLNIKSIEALSYKKPIIATTIGAKGLEDAKKAMVVTDKEEEFALRTVELLNDTKRLQDMKQETVAFVERYNLLNQNALHEIERMIMEREGR